jgi:proteasome accessory factor A
MSRVRCSTMFGLETEYAISGIDSNGRVAPGSVVTEGLMHAAHGKTPALRGHRDAGLFLGNGARFYVDAGDHPEYCTPECTTPWDVVRHAKAGDLFVAGLADDVVGKQWHGGQVLIRKGNVDYSGAGTSWGSHESYLHRRDSDRVQRRLIPHLVSRVIYTGAGGVDVRTPTPTFMVAPRAAHINRVLGQDATGQRGIVNARDQSLSMPGYFRQHIICGESLQSDLALWLRFATTAIVVALADAGLSDRSDLTLASPLEAFATFATDTSLTPRVELLNGSCATALDIQRRLLECAQSHIGHTSLPDWTSVACDAWEHILERLSQGAGAVYRTLDWAIKWRLYQERAERRGVTWQVASLPRALLDTSTADGAAFGSELLEIDARLGQVGPTGLFADIDGSGVLDHTALGVDRVVEALTQPPPGSRASLRADVIRRMAAEGRDASCGWDEVWDITQAKTLDLSDPFQSQEHWLDDMDERGFLARTTEALRADPGSFADDPIALNNRGLAARDRGELELAEALLRRALARELEFRRAGNPRVPHRLNNLSTVLLLRDQLPEAHRLLARAWRLKRNSHDLTSPRILFIRLIVAMLQSQSTATLVGQIKTLILRGTLPDHADVTRSWSIGPMIDTLRARVGGDNHALLKSLFAAINRPECAEALDQFECWRKQEPVGLDAGWRATLAGSPEDRALA